MKRSVLMLVLVAAATAVAGLSGSAVAKSAFPETIRLPDGFRPEGIAIRGNTFYVGSIPTGAVVRGNLRTGAVTPFVPGVSDGTKAAIGMKVDRGRLWVAGGPTGKGFVYSTRTGETLATFQLTTTTPTFVNDVIVTRTAAWFTDSRNQVLYRVPVGVGGQPGTQAQVQTIDLTGAIAATWVPGQFNTNGIDATPNGKTLVIVQSVAGKLFTVTPQGVTTEITLTGLDGNVNNGDGILLDGRTLYVVQNTQNKIAVIRLAPKLGSGRIVRYITAPNRFDVPTTIAEHGNRLYAPNARFTTPPTATTRYDVVQVKKK
jgi:sugar lactone lactonase YvrE